MTTIFSNNFDLMRLLLAVLVVFTHWNILTGSNSDYFIFHLSGVAIDSFFVLSGYVVWSSWQRDPSVKNFYIKRFFRILPLYYLLILIQSIMFSFHNTFTLFDLLKYLAWNMIFLNFMAPTFGNILDEVGHQAINGSLWTLKNEVLFYLCVPVLAYIRNRQRSLLFIFLYLLSCAYILYCAAHNLSVLQHQFPAQMRLFIIGVVLYELKLGVPHYKHILTLVLASLVISTFFNNFIFRTCFYPIILAYIIYICGYMFVGKVKIPDLSYSLYVIHFPIIQFLLVHNYLNSPSAISAIFVALLLSSISILTMYLIEKPSIRYGRKLL